MTVRISAGPTGRLIRDQLRARRAGRVRYRYAQGVLYLPDTYAEYLRGRRRQAVRTNLARAREAGLRVEVSANPAWSMEPTDPRYVEGREPAPTEIFTVWDEHGARVAEALLSVDEQVALLHAAWSEVSYARWLLHAAMVERLCGVCPLMIVNAEDVPLLTPGAQHYQKLLGYSIVRLGVRPSRKELLADVKVRLALLCLGGAGVMVLAHHALLGAGATYAERALAWVAALVVVRRASHRAGPAALTGGLAATIELCVTDRGSLGTALSWMAAAVALDALLAFRPRLTIGSLAIAPAGILVALLAFVIFELTGAAHPVRDLSRATTWAEVITLGAAAACLGWWLGGWVLRLIPVQVRG